MKLFYLFITFFSVSVSAQKEVPNITLKKIDNTSINVKNDFAEKDKIYVLSFWATWCAPCINELEAIDEHYEEWQKEINFEVIAVATDDAKTQKRIKPLLKGKDWDYTILLDTNQDFKRALSINNIPYTIVVKNKKIVYIHNGYSQGEEKELYKVLKSL